ncbi:cell division protein FtsA [Nitratiruptor tergarcus]|uniref:Cell division protein FtsA n=1 Tax=Nitratiruptor tergarcus DSM 16512 TaxID=1069081 RepID=A0A1W1WU21_9BACT|nr:cell division protein FtsA [Nitratiruptor tergarcus]SMC09811.1 cell division protein FtsA [Nitratiruptor tergarcus DSM 16512]
MSKTILALDIGSSKVCAAIAEQKDGELVITGSGIAPAQGLKKGIITNIDLASKSIKKAYEDADRIAGTSPSKAIVALSGAYVKSTNSNGIVNIPNKEISLDEINRVMQTALYNANIPHEYEVLHVLPYRFRVDDQDFIEDPLGMNASRLEVDAHIITAPKSSIFNLKKAVKQAGIDIENIVLSGYASAIAVLNEDEKELGAAVIDLGGSTCNLVIYSGNSLVYNDFLAVGSMHITNDLSMALHTPLSVAEEIKIYYGNLKEPKNDYIEIPVIGDENNTHQVSLEIVYNVIHARVEETLMILANSLEKSGLKEQLGAGVVLTGGMTQLEGLRELASAIFDHLPVRVAKPRTLPALHESLDNPSFSTLIGLILYGNGEYTLYEIDSNKRLRYKNEQLFADTEKSIEPLQKGEESEILDELTNMQSFEEKNSSIKESLAKFTRWLTQLF